MVKYAIDGGIHVSHHNELVAVIIENYVMPIEGEIEAQGNGAKLLICHKVTKAGTRFNHAQALDWAGRVWKGIEMRRRFFDARSLITPDG